MLPSTVLADFTSPINTSPAEPDLLEADGILDTLYGLGDLTRVKDDPDAIGDSYDRWWVDGTASFTAQVKYASHDHMFGFAGSTSTTVFSSTASAVGGGWVTFTAPSLFHLWLYDKATGLTWTSNALSNPGLRDHMVTFAVTDEANLSYGNFVISWEDMDLGDQDYNDVVIELSDVRPHRWTGSEVPLPGSLMLCAIGLVSMAVASRFRGGRR